MKYFAAALLLAAGCSSSSKDDEKEIRAAREFSNKGIAAHDTAAVARIWTEDFHIITSRNAEARGRTANKEGFASEFSTKPDVVYVRTTDKVEVFPSWKMAAESGHWVGTWTEKGEKTKVTGSYFAKWHKIDGRWLLRAEIFVPLTCEGKGYCEESPI